MKNLLLFVLIIASTTLFSQPTNQLNGVYQITSVASGGTGEYQVTGQFTNSEGTYSGLDVAIGDKFFDGKCDIYEVVGVDDGAPYLIVQADRTEGTLGDPTPGIGMIYRPTPNYDYPLESTYLPEKLQTCIQRYTALKIDEDINGALSVDVRLDYDDISGGNVNFNIIDTQDGDNVVGTMQIPVDDIADALPNCQFYRNDPILITGVSGTSHTWTFDANLWEIKRNGVEINYNATPTDVTEYGNTWTIEFHTSVPLIPADEITIKARF